MFEHLVDSSPVRSKKKTLAYFAGTAVVWMAVLAAALAAGVMAYDATLTVGNELIRLPTPPVMLGPRGPRPASGTDRAAETRKFESVKAPPEGVRRTIAPPVINTDLAVGSGNPSGGNNVIASGDPHGVPFGIPAVTADSGKAPEPPPITVEPRRDVEHVNRRVKQSRVLQGSAISKPEPVYPELARRIGLSGQVVVEVVIDPNGNVVSARGVSGHLLLRRAAVEAAWRWKWKPTYLGDAPVQVVGSITFNFSMQ